tara:strand:- start:4 stop:150 length:147 start_codon:yes stop_codon:yes gene_type:complete
MPDHYNEKLYDPSGKDITEKVKKAHKKPPKIHKIKVIPYDPKTEANAK